MKEPLQIKKRKNIRLYTMSSFEKQNKREDVYRRRENEEVSAQKKNAGLLWHSHKSY